MDPLGNTCRIAQVLLPLPLPEAYDYAEPPGLELAIGDIVVAPLGPRTIVGVVSGFKPPAGSNRRLRPIIGLFDAPRLPPGALTFARWASDYAAGAPGAGLALALRGLGAPRPVLRPRFVRSRETASNLTPARLKVLEAAASPMTRAELARASGVSAGVIADMIRVGALVPAKAEDPPRETFDADHSPSTLNESQAAAAEAIGQMVAAGKFSVALLDGVTGSGKTEVYLEAAATALRLRPTSQVLVLLPEIALTEAAIRRFQDRFGAAPAQWHSGVASPRRRETWEAVAEGRARIVVGARSALFLPFVDLRLIIVDEEHDGSYKQDEGFVYHARDLAVARGKIERSPVVLASATPSLETLWNARSGRYRHLRLADRHGPAILPDVGLIDLRVSPPENGRWLSPPLVAAVQDTLDRGEQALLFLNRRGYAPLVICRSCGERMKAPDTDSWLVEHRYTRRLVCHLTGFSMPRPELCPACASRDSLVSVGPGVERVEEEARLLFPDARIAVFSSDTAPDARSARAMIEAMERGDYDIMVATQSAAKGHNFPKLTLVGVVDADVGLRGGDLRAAERTFQLLTQVAGRAGRADRPGRALIQTWSPDHAVMQAIASQDRDGFLTTELAEREVLGLPPFGRLAAVILSSHRPDVLEDFARAFAAAAPNAPDVTIFGPADAPLAVVRGRRRKRILVRAARSVDIQTFLHVWRSRRPPPNSVRIDVDVDPYSFL
ncbi:MAG: primosomal protein N' [Caulobacteraceae bacterium]|nr:primosomal protein N' [Caulobacteraceae bacterium]